MSIQGGLSEMTEAPEREARPGRATRVEGEPGWGCAAERRHRGQREGTRPPSQPGTDPPRPKGTREAGTRGQNPARRLQTRRRSEDGAEGEGQAQIGTPRE